jgi:hypothetical protein
VIDINIGSFDFILIVYCPILKIGENERNKEEEEEEVKML